jgi:hypothetical protein
VKRGMDAALAGEYHDPILGQMTKSDDKKLNAQ